MLEVAAQHGYARASVARVVERADLSRATFYERFDNREDCFLAAYDEVVARIVEELERAEGVRAPLRPRLVLSALLGAAERRPAVAQAMAVEALGAGPAALERRARLHAHLLEAYRRYLDDLPADGSRPLLPDDALIGGVEGVIALRVYRGDRAHLGRLLFDLLDWFDSYALPPDTPFPTAAEWERLGARCVPAPPPSRPGEGRNGTPPEATAEAHERILAAVAGLSVAKGYAATTVTDIIAAAGVSRESFYAHFPGKQDAFQAAQVDALQTTISRVAAAFFGADAWPERVWGGLRALFEYTSENPEKAYLDAVDSCAVGPPAIRRSFDNRMAFSVFLEEGYRNSARARRLPALYSEAIVGAILELLRGRLLRGGGERAYELLPQAAYVALGPFLGGEAALAFVRARSAAK